MLKSAYIHRFRTCENVALENIGSMTVLIGRNGAGKTNVMRAIDWLSKTITRQGTSEFLNKNSDGHISVVFSVGEAAYSYSLEKESTLVFAEKRPEYDIVFNEELAEFIDGEPVPIITRKQDSVTIYSSSESIKISRELKISLGTSFFVALKSILPSEDLTQQLLVQISSFFKSIKYYPLLDLSQNDSVKYSLISGERYQKWVASDQDEDEDDSIVFKLLYLFNEEHSSFTEMADLIGENGLGLISSIDIESIGEEPNGGRKFHLMTFAPTNQSESVSFGGLSFGTRRILSLLVSFFYDKAAVSLIEQPEDGIHFGLLTKLTPLLRAYSHDRQFILASHSSGVLNNMKPDEIRIVELDEGITSVRALSEVEISAAIEYLESEGSFSDFLESV